MPAEGLCGAGFTSPSGIVYLATLVHQGSPLACGCSGPGKAEASPQLPTALRRLQSTLSLGQKASGKGSICPSAMGWLPWYLFQKELSPTATSCPQPTPRLQCGPDPSPTRRQVHLFHPFQCLTLGLVFRTDLLKGNLTYREVVFFRSIFYQIPYFS